MKKNPLKYFVLFLLLILGNTSLLAQKSKVVQSGIGDWALEHLILLMGAATILGTLWAIAEAVNVAIQSERDKLLQEQGIEIIKEEITVVEADSWLKQLYDKSWSLVPVEKEKDILLNHDYDGIRELDNVLPPWWVALFWGGVIIGFAYLGYYHVWDYGQSSSEEYATEMEYAERQINAFLARQPDVVDENNVAILTDESKINLGGSVFIAYCAACHGQQGEGGIGPNLTDKYWIHGGSINDIFKTVKYGVPAKGMIAWKSQLRSSDIQNVSNYILQMQGTNPPNAKEPQGVLVDTSQVIGMK